MINTRVPAAMSDYHQQCSSCHRT